MGNSGSGGWFSSEETMMVQLRLHDTRCLGLSLGEEVCGFIHPDSESTSSASVTLDGPALVPVGVGTTLTVTFHVMRHSMDAASRGRALGEIRLPIEHIARNYGGSLYHTWIPFCAADQSAASPDSDAYELFDRALRNVARDPRWPMVCLSLAQADTPQADTEWYDRKAALAEKALCFHSLSQSHCQHVRMLQALYRQCRSTRQSNKGDVSQLRDGLMDTWASPENGRGVSAGLRQDSFSHDSVGQSDGQHGPHSSVAEFSKRHVEEASRLRQDIASTTQEANARITQASDAITTLKARVNTKHAEHEQVRKDTARLRRDAEMLEKENDQLRSQGVVQNGGREERGVEIKRLQRDIEVLTEQKEALVLILQDLYGAVTPSINAETPQETEMVTRDSPTNAEPLTVEPLEQPSRHQSWTNMLPRPSELGL